jgi:hypothetical protein
MSQKTAPSTRVFGRPSCEMYCLTDTAAPGLASL